MSFRSFFKRFFYTNVSLIGDSEARGALVFVCMCGPHFRRFKVCV